MATTTISTPGAPRAIGPYSQGITANGFLFTAGQVGFDPASGELVDGGIAEQTHRVLQNIRAILRAGAWEILARSDTPAAILITEYVHIANAFFGGREPAMVNAVLDRIARVQRGGEIAGAAAED